MKRSPSLVLGTLLLVGGTIACEKASPTRPSGANTASAAAESVTDARSGVTIVAGKAVSPEPNVRLGWGNQPFSLVVANGVTTGSTALTYTFEVATDAGFANKVFTKENVAQGTGGRTTQAVDKLAGSKTYYWRVRSNSGSTAGPYSATRAFDVGPEVFLATPVPTSPANGANGFAPIALSVSNVQRSGPAGAVQYEFQLSASNSFNPILASKTVSELPSGITSASFTERLTQGAVYFWRARALDPSSGVVTPFSTVFAFTAQNFDFTRAIIHNSPPDLGLWEVGAHITSVDFTGAAMEVDFDRRTGPNRWPDQVPPGFAGPLQYTLGMCLNLSGTWHCAGVVEFWFGRDLSSSGAPSDFRFEWWYDPARWGPMVGYDPAEGELVAVFVGSGDLRGRDWTRATCPGVCERSDVALVPFTRGGASYRFLNGLRSFLRK